MAIFDDVSEGLKAALRARDADRLRALRAMRSAFLNEQKTDNRDTVNDEDCVRLLRRLEKQRQESIEAFAAAGREERAAAERAEQRVIREFLPSLADEAQTRTWVQEAIAETGADSAKQAGRVMGAVMKAHRGEVDGNLARRIADQLLG